MLSNPKKLMYNRFEKLDPDVRLVQVVPYPTVAKVPEKEDELEALDTRYDPIESTDSKLQKMPAISNFISSSDHCRITEYTLECRLYGKQGCLVCAKIGCGVRTSHISIKVNNIRGKLLRWMSLSVIDPLYKARFLSIDNTWAYIDTKSPSLEEPTSNIPEVK